MLKAPFYKAFAGFVPTGSFLFGFGGQSPVDKTIIANISDPNVTRMLRECYDFVTLAVLTLDAKSAFRACGTGARRTFEKRVFLKVIL